MGSSWRLAASGGEYAVGDASGSRYFSYTSGDQETA